MLAQLCFAFVLLVLPESAKADEHGNSESLGHLQPLGGHRPAEGHVDTVDGFLDPEPFYRDYVAASKPVVFKGAAKGIPAYRLWTDVYLTEKFGDMEVRIETRMKETRPQNEKRMTFRSFLATYATGVEGYLVQDVTPQMQADLSLLRPTLCGGWADQIEEATVWMSAGGTQSVLHSDGMENINCLLDGRKQLVMMDKRERRLVEADGWSEEGTYSNVNVMAVDLHLFPSLGRVPWWSANMEKGDCLYIPPRWYHAVKSSGPRNLAANLWFVPLLYFNTSDCARWKGPLPDYSSLSTYRFLVADRLNYIVAQFRLGLFEGCRNFETITFSDLLKAHGNNEEFNSTDLIKLMEGIDANGDQRLTWSEIFAADLPALLLEVGPDFDKATTLSGLLQELRELVDAKSVLKSVVKDRSRRLPEEGATTRPTPPGTQKVMKEDVARKLAELLKDETKNEDEIKNLVGDVFETHRDEL